MKKKVNNSIVYTAIDAIVPILLFTSFVIPSLYKNDVAVLIGCCLIVLSLAMILIKGTFENHSTTRVIKELRAKMKDSDKKRREANDE